MTNPTPTPPVFPPVPGGTVKNHTGHSPALPHLLRLVQAGTLPDDVLLDLDEDDDDDGCDTPLFVDLPPGGQR